MKQFLARTPLEFIRKNIIIVLRLRIREIILEPV